MTFLLVPETSYIVPVSVTATNEAVGYPVAHLNVIDSHPYLRTYRSTTTGTINVDFDFGVSTVFAGVAIFNTNNPVIYIQTDDNAGFTSPTNIPGSPFTITVHKQFRKFFVAASFTDRYIRIRTLVGDLPVGGAAFREIGQIIFFSSTILFPRNPDDPFREHIEREYERSGNNKWAINPGTLMTEWRFSRLPNAQITELLNIAVRGESSSFIMFENEGDNSACSLLRIEDAISFDREGITQSVSFRAKEYI